MKDTKPVSRIPTSSQNVQRMLWADRPWSPAEIGDLLEGVQMHDPDVESSWLKIARDKRLKALYQQKRTADECRERWRGIHKDSLELGVDFQVRPMHGTSMMSFVPVKSAAFTKKMDWRSAFLAQHDIITRHSVDTL